MWPSKWEKIEVELPELLTKWRGVMGQAWEYSTSHSQFLIRFYKPGEAAGLFLYCTDCSQVNFRDGWLNADVKIKFSTNNGRRIYTITDGDHLHIVCGYAGLAETNDYGVRFQDQP